MIKTSRRYATLILGLLALGAILFGLHYLLEIAWQQVLWLFGFSVMAVVVLAIAGFLFAAILHVVKRLFHRYRRADRCAGL